MGKSSFLATKIAPVLEAFRPGAEDLDSLKEFRGILVAHVDRLFEGGELRIHQDNGDGCLLVIRRRNLLGDEGKVGCSENQMRTPREVPYFRAVFNSARPNLIVEARGRKECWRLVSCEAPLTRRRKEKLGAREVACDLVAVEQGSGRLCCIEGKLLTGSKETRLPYAILEAFAYGVCLTRLLELANDEILAQVGACQAEFHPGLAPIKAVGTVASFVAAPKQWYVDHRSGRGIIKAELLLARALSRTLQNSFPREFGGFLTFENAEVGSVNLKDGYVIPFLNPKPTMTCFSDLDALLKQLP